MGSVAQLSIVKGLQQDFVSKPLHRIFEENLLRHSHKIALIYNEDETKKTSQTRHTSYQQLNQKSNHIARFLVREAKLHLLKPNTDGDYVVAVCMQPSDHLITVLMSIWKAGAAYLPIDPSFPENRTRHILNEARPICVIHDDNIDRRPFDGTYTLSVTELFQKSHNQDANNLKNEETLTSSTAIVLYTSGSTGIPKGVRLPHEVILNRLHWQWHTFPYVHDETIGVFKTALTFVDSISELWGPLLCGLAILVLPKIVTKDPERLVHILDSYVIRRLVLVPTLLRSLLMYLKMSDTNGRQKKLLQNLHIWVCSGEPLPVPLAMSFFDYFEEGVHTLFNFYGSTEVMGDVTYFTCESKKQLSLYDRVPIGIPVSNNVIYILDQDYRPVINGQIGEIFVAGYNLANGYVNGRDADRFLENPLAVELKYSRIYRTGDFGSSFNGNIMYEGRTDSQIKIRGHRVDLSEVEKHVAQLKMVDKAMVLCYHCGQMDQALLAFVKLRDDAPLYTELQLEALLKDKLADYMTPQIVIIEQVPLLVNGKVDRQALLKSYESANNNEDDVSIVLDYDYTLVPKHLKSTACDLFETVGGVIGRSTRATLTPRSNFYELGGNSLNSIFTVTLLREKGYSIGISEFISAKNLGEILVKMVKNNKGDAPVPMEDDWTTACPHLDLEAIPLRMTDKKDVIDIIEESFYGKADLEQWLKPDIKRTDYSDIINDIWNVLVEKDLSFIVRDKNTGKTIGTALNFDALDEPEVEVKSKLLIVFEFLEFVEGPIRMVHLTLTNCAGIFMSIVEGRTASNIKLLPRSYGYPIQRPLPETPKESYLPKGLNKILHSFMMGTSSELNPQENIACMNFMEHEVLGVARTKKFAGIFTTNTSPLTQQLGSDVYNYKTLLDYQVNRYVRSDGTLPFSKAPDTQRAIVHWKEI